ncbi:hypothetical protein BD626DRAFT_41073 [Schizophyllum amplum]|uniref:Secreted protein n=1 Tax=Schizophyllum amplum TaxID=97359 RepID=A0A550CDB5_9AGAR|nr:hypothetical protein BD626DRAFT_41073 [Auriculariopsis ampla]
MLSLICLTFAFSRPSLFVSPRLSPLLILRCSSWTAIATPPYSPVSTLRLRICQSVAIESEHIRTAFSPVRRAGETLASDIARGGHRGRLL